jgi:hypothetical protein
VKTTLSKVILDAKLTHMLRFVTFVFGGARGDMVDAVKVNTGSDRPRKLGLTGYNMTILPGMNPTMSWT